MVPPRTVLFLQGPLGPFYGRIAGHLLTAGLRVVRVNFSGNDVADWPHGDAMDFCGGLAEWPDFLRDRIAPLGIDAILMHGDRRPYHKAAARWAVASGVEVLATELGLLRPDWMTLERGGLSTLSHFPSDPDRIRAIAARCEAVDFAPRWRGRTWPLIWHEVRFTVANALGRQRFPGYVSHRAASEASVYAGWLAGRLRDAVRGTPRPLPAAPRYVFALQLEGDLQLREHSPFSDVPASIDHVAASFAAHAPGNTVLVLKPHPHEFNRPRLLAAIAETESRYRLHGRIETIEDRSIAALARGSAGFVSINSSAGIEAIAANCPVHCVLPTLYDVEGLTHQGPLDAFWTEGTRPDHGLFADLRTALAATVQIRGTIYDRQGCKAAAREAAARILAGSVNEPDAFEEEPPRLAKAAALGVHYG